MVDSPTSRPLDEIKVIVATDHFSFAAMERAAHAEGLRVNQWLHALALNELNIDREVNHAR